ncbi:hypothetical protein [Streptomyces sp. SP18CS02]|uniref:hypothetical protein n=1 Tax=Streptomyces sp. SP18CS02 TaxID=3002531 RepID=UPI002E7A5F69|nr:hypothetical protein [Streptomyces sp. SP18CS02]MEE1756792.1 hypothetical protein [Streptomyces sp. SP18CS02]
MEMWRDGSDARDAKVSVVAAMVDAQHRNTEALGRRALAYRVAVLLLLGQILILVVAVAQSSAV